MRWKPSSTCLTSTKPTSTLTASAKLVQTSNKKVAHFVSRFTNFTRIIHFVRAHGHDQNNELADRNSTSFLTPVIPLSVAFDLQSVLVARESILRPNTRPVIPPCVRSSPHNISRVKEASLSLRRLRAGAALYQPSLVLRVNHVKTMSSVRSAAAPASTADAHHLYI